MTLGPIVTSSGLTEDKVIRSKKLTKWTSTYRVHGTRLKIHQYSSWDITSASSLVEVNIDSFQLKIRITMVSTSWIYTMLISNYFPKFSTDLVTALTTLNMYNLSHLYKLYLR